MSADIVVLPQPGPSRSHPVLGQVERYWDELRNGRQAPARAEVHPKGLSGALADCFILERIAPGLARVRVAGRGVAGVLGQEPRGLPFGLLFDRTTREEIEPVLERLFTGPTVADLSVTARGAGRGSSVPGEMLLLPLRDDLGGITRVLGCLKMAGTIGRAGAALTITGTRERPVPKGRALREAPRLEQEAAPSAEILRFPGPAD
ncbi:PAS domain-containing protein [Ovoidimarina sediminis]|uniref:PAS domain-containing protein n=1 Tax=Ovoidimarina sediminis TaxID=3079856 RepID=UPI00290CD38F|nr:PAS domain-containing protein [Rhodophyticola sp. MJ-SS7]MDU8941930.1 PAS domain-containing protein [Rhodophyticola sp. MJ-SS7]